MANKANAESVYKALTAPEEDLLEWALQQEQGGYFNVTADITGTPNAAHYSGCIEPLMLSTGGKVVRLLLTRRANGGILGETCVNTYSSGSWHGWAQLALAIPPTALPLPLAAGIEEINANTCYYSRDQSGRVEIMINARSAAPLISSQQIATLPEGYRPQRTVHVSASLESADIRYAGLLTISYNGTIAIGLKGSDKPTAVYGYAAYYVG